MNFTEAQTTILRKLLEEGKATVEGDPRPWRGLANVGLILLGEKEATLTAKGRGFVEEFAGRLSKGRARLTVVQARAPKKQGRKPKASPARTPAKKSNGHSRLSAAEYERLRAEIVTRYEADLAALDRVIEIARAIEAQA